MEKRKSTSTKKANGAALATAAATAEQQQQRQHGARDTRNVLAAISARVDETVDAYDDDGIAGLRLAYEGRARRPLAGS